MYWNVIFVCDPWTTELHEMNANCYLDAEISVFACFYGV